MANHDVMARLDGALHRAARHMPWAVPAFVAIAVLAVGVVVDRRSMENGRSAVVAAVRDAALAAAEDPVIGERRAAEVLQAAALADGTRFTFERGRMDGRSFVALDGAGSVVRVRVGSYLVAPVRTFFGFPQPTVSHEAVATLTGSMLVELGPANRTPGPIGRVLVDRLLGVTLGFEPRDWATLRRIPVPLDRFLAAVRGGLGTDALGGPVPMRLAVESLAIAAIPPDESGRVVLTRLVEAIAQSGAETTIARSIRLPDSLPSLPTSTALDLLLEVARGAATAESMRFDLVDPAPGVLDVAVGVRFTGIDGAARVQLAFDGARMLSHGAHIDISARVLPGALPDSTALSVPLHLQVGPATAMLGRIDCADTAPVPVTVAPAAVTVSYGPGPGSAPVALLDGTTVSAWLQGADRIEDSTPTVLRLLRNSDGQPESVRSTLPFRSMIARMLASPAITVEVDGSRIDPASAREELADIVRDVGPFIEAAVVDLVETLGVSPGEATVRIHDQGCRSPTLIDG